jgi:hypothetical protein
LTMRVGFVAHDATTPFICIAIITTETVTVVVVVKH